MRKLLIMSFFLNLIFLNFALAWDNKYVLKTDSYSSAGGSRFIEMQKKYDYDISNKYRGEIDSYGNVRLRNLNGDTLRGYIDKDGYGTLRDYNGNIYKVRP
ncbi:MAG: hypothetical protein QXL18_05405 [Candidatus Woesearchaeota archaeon]